jgi:hypothetical protein
MLCSAEQADVSGSVVFGRSHVESAGTPNILNDFLVVFLSLQQNYGTIP